VSIGSTDDPGHVFAVPGKLDTLAITRLRDHVGKVRPRDGHGDRQTLETGSHDLEHRVQATCRQERSAPMLQLARETLKDATERQNVARPAAVGARMLGDSFDPRAERKLLSSIPNVGSFRHV
jgi:hypothetical protein